MAMQFTSREVMSGLGSTAGSSSLYVLFAANIQFERIVEYSFRTHCCACQTEYAFGGEHSFSIAEVLQDIDVHRACLVACTALCAFLFVPFNLE